MEAIGLREEGGIFPMIKHATGQKNSTSPLNQAPHSLHGGHGGLASISGRYSRPHWREEEAQSKSISSAEFPPVMDISEKQRWVVSGGGP